MKNYGFAYNMKKKRLRKDPIPNIGVSRTDWVKFSELDNLLCEMASMSSLSGENMKKLSEGMMTFSRIFNEFSFKMMTNLTVFFDLRTEQLRKEREKLDD